MTTFKVLMIKEMRPWCPKCYMYVCMYVCMYIHTYTHTHTHIYIYTYYLTTRTCFLLRILWHANDLIFRRWIITHWASCSPCLFSHFSSRFRLGSCKFFVAMLFWSPFSLLFEDVFIFLLVTCTKICTKICS